MDNAVSAITQATGGAVDLTQVMNTELGGFSLGHIFSAVLVFLICRIAIRIIMKLTDRIIGKMNTEKRVSQLVLKVISIVLNILSVIIIASALGINTSSLVALVSVASLGVTIAAEDILGNIAGGIVILTTKPFIQGDVIEVNGNSGTVLEMNLTATRLKTADGVVVVIPNKELSSSKMINYTVLGTRRVVIDISASYDAPAAQVREALLRAAAVCPKILPDPAPAVCVASYDDSAIRYTLVFWVKAADYLSSKNMVNERIRDEFEAGGIEMTYNHINVHMISGN